MKKTGTKKLFSCLAAAVLLLGVLSGCANNAQVETAAAAASTAAAAVTETEAETAAQSETTAAPTKAPETETQAEAAAPKQEVTVLFTNDIHSYIYNTAKDKDGNVTPALRISNIKAYFDQLKKEGRNVLLVDAGDTVQGSVYGGFDQGASIIEMMSKTGYDLAVPGNHDFDFGMDNFKKMTSEAGFPYISCNFRSEETGELVFPATKVYEFGGTRIAFVGISTPETVTTSTPKFFQNEQGEFIYSFDGEGDPKKLYASVQAAIDSVKDNADYVIALGHVGNGLDEKRLEISSEDIIRNTSGLDVFIDGHSHNTVPGKLLYDLSGKEVMLTQTGAYLSAFGELTLTPDQGFTVELKTGTDAGQDEEIAVLEEKVKTKVSEMLGVKIATLGTTLYINNPQKYDQRLIRSREMNSGDFVADSMYWYFNDKMGQTCDMILSNGGGIRAQVEAGDVTALNIRNLCPFGNQVCIIRASGQNILDALEMGVTVTGEWDAQWDTPAENGAFMQVAGMRYTVDPSVPSGVKVDEKGNFLSVEGDRRIKDAEVFDRESGKYIPLDPEATYTVGGVNYLLRNGGNGLVMFSDCDAVMDYAGQDSDVLVEYITSFNKNGSYPHVSTENCPLKKLENYQLDYENPYGAGRITILGGEEQN